MSMPEMPVPARVSTGDLYAVIMQLRLDVVANQSTITAEMKHVKEQLVGTTGQIRDISTTLAEMRTSAEVDRRDVREIKSDHERETASISERLNRYEKRIEELEKWRWLVMGAITVMGTIWPVVYDSLVRPFLYH